MAVDRVVVATRREHGEQQPGRSDPIFELLLPHVLSIADTFRDEPRPSPEFCAREFTMKDSYSFDVDRAGLDISSTSTPTRTGEHQNLVARTGALGSRADSARCCFVMLNLLEAYGRSLALPCTAAAASVRAQDRARG